MEAALEEMESLTNAAQREKRELTRTEVVKFDQAEVRAAKARSQISEAEAWLERNPGPSRRDRAAVPGVVGTGHGHEAAALEQRMGFGVPSSGTKEPQTA